MHKLTSLQGLLDQKEKQDEKDRQEVEKEKQLRYETSEWSGSCCILGWTTRWENVLK